MMSTSWRALSVRQGFRLVNAALSCCAVTQSDLAKPLTSSGALGSSIWMPSSRSEGESLAIAFHSALIREEGCSWASRAHLLGAISVVNEHLGVASLEMCDSGSCRSQDREIGDWDDEHAIDLVAANTNISSVCAHHPIETWLCTCTLDPLLYNSRPMR